MLEKACKGWRGVAAALCVVALAGCVSKVAAPVESRVPGGRAGTAASAEAAAPAVARPGYYIVKKGDTLYSVAHQHERDFRELASWNGLDDVNVIKVGQELRVVPPDQAGSAVGSKAIAAPSIETRPLDAPTPLASASNGVSASAIKTEPKGGRIAYSAQAWKDLQAGVVKPSTPVAVAPKADAKVDAKPAPTSAGEGKQSAATDDDVDWIWPSQGKVIATFNDSAAKPDGANKGVDIAGNVGDPVLAASAGRVVYVGTGVRGYGNLVIIKHNNSNYISAYAHNSEVFVKEQQVVQKGQKIAALGSSDTDRPKLHFEIRKQGRPVDPLKYLPSR